MCFEGRNASLSFGQKKLIVNFNLLQGHRSDVSEKVCQEYLEGISSGHRGLVLVYIYVEMRKLLHSNK